MFKKQTKWISFGCALIVVVWIVIILLVRQPLQSVKENFLPDVEHNPVALDLKSGELIEINCKGGMDFDNPVFFRALKKLRNADLIIDNGHIGLLDARFKETPYIEGDNTYPSWYKISKFLPYATVITTTAGRTYNLNVLKTTREGCLLIYSPASDDAKPRMLIAEKNLFSE